MIATASRFKELLNSHLVIDDWEAIDLIMAIVASHKITGNMLWTRIIGASGSGKTEILRTLLSNKEYCTAGEGFTPSAIRRGHKPKDEAQTMLERWNGKLVITKEFNTMLTKNKELKKETFGLLRSVHDGEIAYDYGSEQGFLNQVSHFDWILGVTDYVDKQRELEENLGSRFIDIRWGKGFARKNEVAKKAYTNDCILESVRSELAEAMTAFINEAEVSTVKPLDGDELTWLAEVSTLVATLRTTVKRDRSQGGVVGIPSVEAPTRVIQAFGKIVKSLQGIGIDNYKPYIIRLMLDSMAVSRQRVFSLKTEGVTNAHRIASITGLSVTSVSYIIEDLNVLGIDYDAARKIMPDKNILKEGEL